MKKQINFTNKKDNKKIAALLFLPDEVSTQKTDKKYPTVIFAHGFGGDYTCLEHYGDGYAEKGIVCIIFDFCGGGLKSHSDGTMKEMTILTEVDNLDSVVDEVKHLSYVDENKIFLQGESQGGFVSAYEAAQIEKDVDGLILWYPALCIPDDSRRRFEEKDDTCFGTELSPEFNEVAKDIDIFSVMKKYHGPVKIIHGDKDEVVSINYSKKALEAYKNNYTEFDVLAGAGHGFVGDDTIKARDLSIEFILKNA